MTLLGVVTHGGRLIERYEYTPYGRRTVYSHGWLQGDYVGKRVNMTDYPSFRAEGYDYGSGPTESVCGGLPQRLKGSGLRWAKDNAEGMIALGSIYYSGQWDTYWKQLRKAS